KPGNVCAGLSVGWSITEACSGSSSHGNPSGSYPWNTGMGTYKKSLKNTLFLWWAATRSIVI
ncbi:hypothetical protein L5593_006935, partial [Pseudomonas aeruginosa]